MHIVTWSCSLFVLLSVPSILADVNVSDYVFWAKADISAWHEYFPSRLLEQERLTNRQAKETVRALLGDMETSLSATVRYQAQELQTAQMMMEGTSAQGCISGIATYMDNAIDEGVSSFTSCSADVESDLNVLYTALAKKNASYNAVYQRTLAGIDSCVRTYPNRDSWSRLKTCVSSWVSNYYTMAGQVMSSLDKSPAMGKFSFAVQCAQEASQDVQDRGWKFLDMLVNCAKLSENVDSEMYEEQLTSEFYKYVTYNSLESQISAAQIIIEQIVRDIENIMNHFYQIKRVALQNCVIESRNESYYNGMLVQYIKKYLDTVSLTSVDNPANAECVAGASAALNTILTNGAAQAMECDVKIVSDTKRLMSEVDDNFSDINRMLPHIGNVAILSCLGEGYVFADSTIYNCFSLSINSFNVTVAEIVATIVDDVGVLQGYEKSFFTQSSLPCGNSIRSRAFVEADRALYDLQRCLYISSGTRYAVTTSAPDTTAETTVASSTTETTPSTTVSMGQAHQK